MIEGYLGEKFSLDTDEGTGSFNPGDPNGLPWLLQNPQAQNKNFKGAGKQKNLSYHLFIGSLGND
jgi:hypothetical protein